LRRHLSLKVCERYNRVWKLIEPGDNTFQEIGKQVGLTRERVRQIAQKRYPDFHGHRGRSLAVLRRRLARWEVEPFVAPFYEEARARGFAVAPHVLSRPNGYMYLNTRGLLVNGYDCQVRKSVPYKYSLGLTEKPVVRAEVCVSPHRRDFSITHVPSLGFFIVPAGAEGWRRHSVPIFPERAARPGGIRAPVWKYLNAWHLLETPKARTNSDAVPSFKQEKTKQRGTIQPKLS
jgi:hypothetical protein